MKRYYHLITRKNPLLLGKGLEFRKSNIPDAGKGLFTNVNIRKNSHITFYQGTFIANEHVKTHKKSSNKYTISLGDDWIIDGIEDYVEGAGGASLANDASHNTDFKNNCYFLNYKNEEIWLVALCDIKAGEELFCSYGDEYW